MNKLLFDPFSFSKAAVGFDDVFKRLTDLSENLPKIPTYPPYNIKKVDENKYVIEMAVAGFGRQDIELELQDGILSIAGSVKSDEGADYLYKGIADRAFTRKFTLADTVEVKNADLINGMLKIWLERFIPEEKKPKKIPINTGAVGSEDHVEIPAGANGPGGPQGPKPDTSTQQFLSEKYSDK
jgi:molecular chaperone IbpA